MSKKKLFEDNLENNINLKNSFVKGIEEKNQQFNTQGGRVLFELQKTYKGDQRFKLDERFMDDIDQKLLPESVQLNLDQNVNYKLQNLNQEKNEFQNEEVDESWGIINNEDELWREKKKVLGQEILKVKKKQKFNPIKRYDPTKPNQEMQKPQISLIEKITKNNTIQKQPVINKNLPKKQPKKKKIKKKDKNKNIQNNNNNAQQTKKSVKINFSKLKEIKKDKNQMNDFKLFSQLIKFCYLIQIYIVLPCNKLMDLLTLVNYFIQKMSQSQKELDWNNLLNIVQQFKQDYDLEKNELLLKIEELQTENQHLKKQNQLQKRQIFLLRKKYNNLPQNISENVQTLNTECLEEESFSDNSQDSQNEMQKNEEDIDLNKILKEFDIKDILNNLKDEQQKIIFSENTSFSKSYIQQDQNLFIYYNHLDCVRNVKYFKQNQNDYLISIAEDGLIVIQDLNDSFNKKILRSHLGPIYSICIDYQKKKFFTAGCEGWISIWQNYSDSIMNIKEPKNIYLFNDIVYSIDLNQQYQNKLLVTSREEVTLIYDYEQETTDVQINENYIFGKYDQINNNQILFSCDSQAQIDFYDIQKQIYKKRDLELKKQDQINCIDFNIDRDCYLFASDYGKVLLYNQKDDKIEQNFNYQGFINQCQFIDNYKFIIVGEKGFYLYDIRQQEYISHQEIGGQKFNENLTCFDLHQNQNYLYLGCADSFIYRTEINQF